MSVQVQLFAAARERAGVELAEVELDEPATIGTLRIALLAMFPQLEPIAPHLLFAINDDYATDDSAITPGARIACFPPVSGG